MEDFELSPYERDAHAEIVAWRDRKSGVFSRAIDGASQRVLSGLSRALPEQLTGALSMATESALERLKDAAYWTYSERALLEEAARLGIQASRIVDLGERELSELDPLARRYFDSNSWLAALEGAGTGFGGAVLIAADIPALFAIAFRAIQQIGSAYGFEMRGPELRPLVLSVLGAGSARNSAAKTQALLDMRITARAFASGLSYQRVAEMTTTGAVAHALRKVSEKLPRDIAKELSRRKLAQLLPFVGAAVGAGFNYWFLRSTTEAAYMLFRELYLERKYPGFPASRP